MSGGDVKWQLQIIFIYYTSYADRNNFRLLKQQNYRRFLIDSETVKQQSSLVHYDIVFQKISHSAIIFKDFLALVPDIAEILYKKHSRAQAFREYLRTHLQPLYTEILEKSDFGQDIARITNAGVNLKIHKSLQAIPALEKVYQQYIGRTRHAKDPYQIFQNFINLLKECQLSPQLISKSMAYILYLHIIKEEDETDVFNFNDFVTSLILIAQASERKVSSGQLSDVGRVTKILQRMEISQGFERISKKVTCETAISPSILKGFMDAHRDSEHFRQSEEEFSRVFPASTRHKNCNSSFNFLEKEKLKKDNYNSVKSAINQESRQFSRQSRQIKQAFEDLCSFGEVANTKTLKSIKIKKLYERTGLMGLVGKTWLDIQIVNLQRSSGTGKIEFPQFLELLSVTARKVDFALSQICHLVLEDKLQNDQQMIEHSAQFSRAIGEYSPGDQQILKGILSQAEKQLQKVYFYYSGDRKLMPFGELSKCMYELQVFPGILSKHRLFHIFSALSDVREDNEAQSLVKNQVASSRVKTLETYLKDEKMIEFSGFLLAVIEIAQEICDQSLAPPQKLIVLLQKINDTKGYKSVSGASLVKEVRAKFGSYYASSFKRPQKQVQSFDELLEGFN